MLGPQNPEGNNMFQPWVDLTRWNIDHNPKWKKIDQQILMAWTLEELPWHSPTTYKTKLQYYSFNYMKKNVAFQLLFPLCWCQYSSHQWHNDTLAK